MNASLQSAVESLLSEAITSCEPVAGGSIGTSYKLSAGQKTYFLKTGKGAVAETFHPEARGLSELSSAGTALRIPDVYDLRVEKNGTSFLLLEWIEEGTRGNAFWEQLGKGLAELHRYTGETYGFSDDNFIGRLPQVNDERSDWPTFFWENRLQPQIELARGRGRWDRSWDPLANQLGESMRDLLPPSPDASLLHGDLWGGNVMADKRSRPVLIDPAVYYGHREADLALTELFGGFDSRFYQAYRSAHPLDAGYEERHHLYNLYHLINHLNHFGQTYAPGVKRILERFGG